MKLTILLSCLFAAPLARADAPLLDKAVNAALTCATQLEPHDEYSYPYKAAEFKARHPSFFGCFDWHASVFNHAALVRTLNKNPAHPRAAEIKALLAAHFSPESITIETRNMKDDILVKMYEPAWFLQLMLELRQSSVPEAPQWVENLKPMEQIAISIFSETLTTLSDPDQGMMHPNSAFAMARAWDYAIFMGNSALQDLIHARAQDFYAKDSKCDAANELDDRYGIVGFVSPCFAEADLMRRTLPANDYDKWFAGFFPALPPEFLLPVTPGGRYPYYQAGLMLQKAAAMRSIALAFPGSEVARKLLDAADGQIKAAEPLMYTYGYMGEHWLPAFYLYAQ